MAIDKPWRHIEVRPKAVASDWYGHHQYSLIDKTKLTKLPNHYLLDMVWGDTVEGVKRVKENNRIKKLIDRRKRRQKYCALVS